MSRMRIDSMSVSGRAGYGPAPVPPRRRSMKLMASDMGMCKIDAPGSGEICKILRNDGFSRDSTNSPYEHSSTLMSETFETARNVEEYTVVNWRAKVSW